MSQNIITIFVLFFFSVLTTVFLNTHGTKPKEHKSNTLSSKNCYGPKVKVENWQLYELIEPKDNNVYPISQSGIDDHVSTYWRLGTDDQGVRTTETRDMLAQVYLKSEPMFPFKPLVNFTSYPCTDTPARNRLMKKANLSQLHPEYGVMDYISTNQKDYRMPYPKPLEPLRMPTEKWLMNRVICSDLTQNYGTAPPSGDYQFLDEHTPIGHIRKLRHWRCQSFNPATCLKDFPEDQPAYGLTK